MKMQTLMKMPQMLLLALLLGSAFLFAQGGDDEQEVIAKGLGAIIAGDEAKASDDALASALRNAVEQVVGTMIQSNTLVENYQLVEDRIYNRTQGYVKSYQKIGESNRGNNVVEVTIRAVVKKSNLESDLAAIGLLMGQKNKPRMMVLIDEKNMGTHYGYYNVDMNTTATEFTNKFIEKGFSFVDQNVVANKLRKEAVLAAIQGDAAAAQSIAQESGAEVLIIGTAISKPASGGAKVVRDAGLVSCQATMNLRAVRADDGNIIAVVSKQGAAVHIDQMTGGTQALQKAAGMAAEELMAKILKAWQKDVYSSASIQMRVMNIPGFNDLLKFKNMLQSYVRGVQNIYQRDFSGGTALLELEARASTNQIAEELALKDFSPYQVEIINVSQNMIVVKLNMAADQ
ncbi:MAG: hypothetical protein H6628_10100 [Calditrichae bacterium]|nr:hypothetical protein [Calditrichia bacterium]